MSPNPKDVRETIAELMKTQLSRVEPLPEGDLAEHLDSVERMSLVVAIEDHFEIIFEAEDEETVRTLDDVIAVVRAKLSPATDA